MILNWYNRDLSLKKYGIFPENDFLQCMKLVQTVALIQMNARRQQKWLLLLSSFVYLCLWCLYCHEVKYAQWRRLDRVPKWMTDLQYKVSKFKWWLLQFGLFYTCLFVCEQLNTSIKCLKKFAQAAIG